MKNPNKQDPLLRSFHHILYFLTILTLINLLFTASIVGLLGGIVILVMVWGIKKGDYPLTKALRWFLLIYGIVNLAVLLLTLFSAAQVRLSAVIWLGLYSCMLLFVSGLLGNKKLQNYLKTAPQPPEKEKKITFFRGGWRDL